MIDIEKIRTDGEAVASVLAKRGIPKRAITDLLEADNRWRELTEKVDTMRAEQNQANGKVAEARGEDKEKQIEVMQEVSKKLKESEKELAGLAEDRNGLWRALPNLVLDNVPEGGEADGIQIKKVNEELVNDDGTNYQKWEGKLFDLEAGAKVSGSRFAFIDGQLARLQIGLVAYIFDKLAQDGFSPVIPPVLVGEKAMAGMGYLDHEGDEIYRTQGENYLVGTSEQAIGPRHMGDTIDGADLPRRYVGYSSCFRREAGSHGQDVKGLMRLHQFEKVEMFSFAHPEDSEAEHEFMVAKQEEIMLALELPYRVVLLAAGDMGAPSAKTYDIETWMPSQAKYRETSSCSNTTDYQARRLNINYKDEHGKGKLHMLNGTAVAMSRIFIAILENHQQDDGSVAMPKALHPYLPFTKIEAE